MAVVGRGMKVAFALLAVSLVIMSGCLSAQYGSNATGSGNFSVQAQSTANNITIEIISSPGFVQVGNPATISWRVGGNISGTAIYYAHTQRTGVFNESMTVDLSGFENFTSGLAQARPGMFSANITPLDPRVLYYRVHATADGRNYWTEERALAVAYPPQEESVYLYFVSVPASVEVGKNLTFVWNVEGMKKNVTSSAVYYGYRSNPRLFGIGVTPAEAGYPEFTRDFSEGSFEIPYTFVSTIVPDRVGVLYYRAYAQIEWRVYWTEEGFVNITSPPPPKPQLNVSAFAIEADDSGFYMPVTPVSSISVDKGNIVNITFRVRTENVYDNGLDFLGCGEYAGGAKPAESVTFEFTANGSCVIYSHRPSSAVVKAGLKILVH